MVENSFFKCSVKGCNEPASVKIFHRNNKKDIIAEEYRCIDHISMKKGDIRKFKNKLFKRK